MELMRYREEYGGARPVLVIGEGRKWMQILMVDDGRLRIRKLPIEEQRYMAPLTTNERKARASFRRLARKPGTSRKIRQAIKESV
jgi:hypothetical protein